MLNTMVHKRNFEDYFENLVQEWNDAHISKDTNVFSALFNYTVLYYGNQLEKKSCIENKLSFFTRNPDYHQQIQGKIQVEKISDFKVKCSFVKRVNIKQVATDYPSYLLFKKIEDQWKIITEGDLVTDKNIAKVARLSDVEADFIINYDIKYRMGADEDDAE